MRWLAVLLVLSAWPADAQKKPKKRPAAPVADAASEWPIQKLVVSGNRHYAPQQILAVAGLRIGQKAGKTAFEAARDRLVATGAFDTVGYRFEPGHDGQGYVATFDVAEVDQLFPIRFEDMGLPDETVRRWLAEGDPLFGPKIPATKQVLDRYAKRIEELLTKEKRPEKVIGKITSEDANQLTALFRPARMPPAIARVVFTGNAVVPSYLLQNSISNVAVGQRYTEPRMRELLETSIRPLYDARGRLRASFPKIQISPEKAVNGLLVTVQVEEGPSYNLGDVTFVGAKLTPKELQRRAKLKTGDIANFDDVRDAVDRVQQFCRRDGFLRVSSTQERKIDDEKKVVVVVVHISLGPQFAFGNLEIAGLDIISEPVIRKMWGLAPGKPFDEAYPDRFLSEVRAQGMFDNLGDTKSESKIDEVNHTVDVILHFKGEGPKKPKKEGQPGEAEPRSEPPIW